MNAIDLHRTFADYEDSRDRHDDVLGSYLRKRFRSTASLDWGTVQLSRVVVVLGEAGSGKTTELELQHQALIDAGATAFYLRLESLAVGRSAAFDPVQQSKLEAWKEGRDEATFLLDSVDEARLERHAAFDEALNNLANAIGADALPRARVIVCSRVSEWNEPTDRRQLEAKFLGGVPRSDSSDLPTPSIRVVVIEPLGTRAFRALASASGAQDIDAFVQAVDDAGAWDFAARPLDVVRLVGFWSEKGRLGSLTELVAHNVERKLVERRPANVADPLTPDRARQGAECLAACSILTRRTSFRLAQDSEPHAEGTLDPNECIPSDWTAADVRSLLNRPLFDPAAFLRIRFHHRTVTEYLAAAFFRRLVDAGCPVQEVEDQLFASIGGEIVLRRSLEGTASWLATARPLLVERIRTRLIETAPFTLLQNGDPQCLPIESRRQILRALLSDSSAKRGIGSLDGAQLGRFAHDGLAGDIDELLHDPPFSEESRIFLLRLVARGRIRASAEGAARIAFDKEVSERLRCHALEAVASAGGSAELLAIREWALRQAAFTSRVGAVVCRLLYPQASSLKEVFTLVERSAIESSGPADPEWYRLQGHFAECVPEEEFDELVACSTRLIKESIGRPKSVGRILPRRWHWLVGATRGALARILNGRSLHPNERAAAGAVLALCDLDSESSVADSQMPALLVEQLGNLQTRKCYLAVLLALLRGADSFSVNAVMAITHSKRLVALTGEDVLLLAELGAEAAGEEAQRYFEVAEWVARSLRLDLGERRRIRKALRSKGEVAGRIIAARRGRLVHRMRRSRVWLRYESGFALRKAVRRFQSKFSQFKCYWLARGEIESGRALGLLAQIVLDSMNGSAPSRWGGASKEALFERYPRWLARRAVRGLVRSWTQFTPTLPHEQPHSNQVANGVIAGLSGIGIALDEGELSLSHLSAKEARLMTCYAVNEINGLPDWLGGIASQNSEAVRHMLLDCISAEFRIKVDAGSFSGVLTKVQYGSTKLKDLVGAGVLGLLDRVDACHAEVVRAALGIQFGMTRPNLGRLARIARRKASSLDTNSRAWLHWFAAWIQLTPTSAIRWLEASVERSGARADELVTRICASLNTRYGAESVLVRSPRYLKPKHMERLIVLAHEHVRVDEDRQFESGVCHTVTQRDEAEDFRRGLLPQLCELEGPDVLDTLKRLASRGGLECARGYIDELVAERRASDADGPPWTAAQVLAFLSTKAAEPRTDGDLFVQACRQLDSIKDDVERADFSERGRFSSDVHESELRKFLGARLKSKGAGLYDVSQEEEVDNRKEPDLRVRRTGIEPVSIEVKWGQKWSYAELASALREQLVGQYLRSVTARFGCLVLGVTGSPREWIGPNGERISFGELCADLQRLADELVSRRIDIDGLYVVGIDFRPPPS